MKQTLDGLDAIKFRPVKDSDPIKVRLHKSIVNRGIKIYERELNEGESHDYAETRRDTYIKNELTKLGLSL